MNIKIKLGSELAKLPEYKTIGASGMDVSSIENVRLLNKEVKAISTGLYFDIPAGYEIQVRPRSGLALNKQITVLNTPGTIDCDYRGELKVILMNLGTHHFDIEVGDRIAQIVVCPVIRADLEVVNELSPTVRSDGGFGSTGIK
jgi:dUTP pyrophosphatase